MTDWPILSTVTFLPLVGAFLLLWIRDDNEAGKRNIRSVTLLVTVFTFLVSLGIWIGFDKSTPGFQMVEEVDWLDSGIAYRMGVDGISMLFIILTTFLMPLCILASWESVQKRVKAYMIAFLVLETREHAEGRGAKAYAVLDKVIPALSRRADGTFAADIAAMITELGAAPGLLAISGASGAHGATRAEREALSGYAVRALSSLTGHMKEAQLPFAVALAALSVHNASAPPPLSADEPPLQDAPEAVVTTAIGYHRSEGVALVRKA